MSRRLPEEFQGKELAPLCLASSPQEAQEIETTLDEAGPKEGVMFLVPTENVEPCLTLLHEAGLSHLVIE